MAPVHWEQYIPHGDDDSALRQIVEKAGHEIFYQADIHGHGAMYYAATRGNVKALNFAWEHDSPIQLA